MDKDILKDAQEEFKCCVDAESDQRKESLDDLEFAKLGKQWPDDVKSNRDRDGRPCLTINRLPAFIKQVTNDARQTRPSIVTKPVGDGADKDTSRILNDLIRNIEIVSSADIAYDTALEFAVTMGLGYVIVRTDYTCDDAFDQDIQIERVSNPFSVYGDYESKSATSDDWNRAFVTDMYTKDAFERKWPDAKSSGFDAEGDETRALWFSDKAVRVAEWWKREEVQAKLLQLTDGSVMREEEYLKIRDLLEIQGISVKGTRPTRSYKVTQRLITGDEVLETNEWAGKYIPIIPMYGDEVNVNGKRYFQSLVRFAKDPQRMFNYWRTAATELVALAPKAPWVGAVGAFTTDAAKWASANTTNHQHLEYDPVPNEPPPQRQAFAGVPAGALQEAMNASDDMKNIMGLHDASMGAQSNETSGKAIMARQREGDVSTFNFIDNRNRCVEHIGRIVVDLIPKIYTVPRIVRCIKEDGSSYSVPVNQPAMPAQQAQPQPGQRQGEPELNYEPAQEHIEGVTKLFDLTSGKYDVSVQAGPSYTSKRQESADQMMEFIRVFPNAAPVVGDLLAKNLDWPGAEDVAERLRAMLPPPAQGQNPQLMQMQQQMQQMDQQAREAIGQLRKELEAAKADKDIERSKLAIDAFEAETKRMQVIGDQRLAAAASAQQASADLMAQQAPPGQPAAQDQPPPGGFSLTGQQGIEGNGAPQ